MKILHAGQWIDTLDPWRAPDEARIQVHAWLPLEPLSDLYIEPQPSLRKLLDYSREIGPLHVARKVASRLGEQKRAQKWVACGLGRIIEAPNLQSGTPVAFFAPRVPEATERVVVPMEFVRVWEGEGEGMGSAQTRQGARPLDPHYGEREQKRMGFVESHPLLPQGGGPGGLPPGGFGRSPTFPFPFPSSPFLSAHYAGGRFWGEWGDWQRESGRGLDGAEGLMERVVATLGGQRWELMGEGVEFTEVRERVGGVGEGDGVLASVVGWGHHARTVIVPNLPGGVVVGWVHELDPMVVEGLGGVVVDTAPVLREDERPGVVFAAGYHGSHAGVAASALGRGAYAVSEKPLATTRGELVELLEAWVEPSRYFAAFHKRYSPFNGWLRADLGWGEKGPMSYVCVVHEITTPRGHWYRWPSAGSRILSNGCHWIDHFLYLNDFERVEGFEVRVGRDGAYLCDVWLVNGACFHMVLGDRGSDRLGTREHVEVRTAGCTAVITDGRVYRSEDEHRLLRRAKLNKLAAHAAMYRAIGDAVVRGAAGDSRESVERSAGLVLEMEEALT